jgi:hypothetical protein
MNENKQVKEQTKKQMNENKQANEQKMKKLETK